METDNLKLTNIPDMKEVWEAICSLDSDSAPGPDGFTGHLFQLNWDTIQHDIVISGTTLTLIPKIEKPGVS